MKKELQSLHGGVKSFRKAAEDRIEEVFFTHPEWRKPKTLAAVDLVISRIDEVYYPFSTNFQDKLVVPVWKQVLSELRDKMIEAIEAAEKPEPIKKTVYIEHVPGQADHDHSKFMTEAGLAGAGPGRHTQSVDPELPASLPSTKEWTKTQIAQLHANINKARCGSWIARDLKASQSVICSVLNGKAACSVGKRSSWLDRIAVAFDKRETLRKGARAYEELKQSIAKPNLVCSASAPMDATAKILGDLIEPAEYPASQISELRIEIDKGKLIVHLTVDVAEAIQRYIDKATEKAVLGKSGDLLE